MKTIKKKTWKKYFQLMVDGKKDTDIRLADFEISVGDQIMFEEYDPDKEEYTDRVLIKKVKNLNWVQLYEFHTPLEIKKRGHWIIETI
jgi:ASC-1-like (ASCH) protein